MSAPIGPGDWIEFYRGFKGRPVPDWSPISLGHAYRVARLAETYDDDGITAIPGVIIDGYETFRGQPCAFPLECFRPISGRRRDLIETLKQPAPDAVRELIATD